MEALISFVILLVISLVVSAIIQYGLKFTLRPGPRALVFKTIVGYFGAWWGTTVYGQWWENLNYGDVYYIPAVLGAFSLVWFTTALLRLFGTAPK